MKPILIVDDNADTREVICAMLAYEGYAVVHAPNGKQALDILVSAEQESPCLIVLDLGMPVMSGWEFLETVRGDARLATIPVLVTSGTHVNSEALKHDAVVGCLAKPVNFEKMLDMIRRLTPPSSQLTPPKVALKEQLIEVLSADLLTRERAYRAARDGATNDEAKPENDKDTRALEQSYLARGEALRIEELRTALAEVQAMTVRDLCDDEPMGLGALVTTRNTNAGKDGAASLFWLAPHGGGSRLAGGTVQVLTPKSPIGRALLGKGVGDECEVLVAGTTRALTIVAMR